MTRPPFPIWSAASPRHQLRRADRRRLRRQPLWLAGRSRRDAHERGQANAGPNASWLGAVESWDDETPLDADEIELPFYKEIELSGGKGSTVILQTGGRKLRFGKYTPAQEEHRSASAACVTVSGNSMEPVLPDGSTVGVDTSARTIKDGDMYAFDHDGQLRVKLLYRLPGGGLRIRSFNSDEHPDERYELPGSRRAHQRDRPGVLVLGAGLTFRPPDDGPRSGGRKIPGKKRACIAAGPFGMAHSGGFEPPTARFVAEYSIQLSYECVSVLFPATCR